MDPESEMTQLNTNYLGPMQLIRSSLPIFREQRQGQIINISSVSGMVAMPTMASYSASKQALEGASEALWYEARPYGISVTLVEPGFVHSESFRRVRFPNKAKLSNQLAGPHSEYYRSMSPFIEKLMKWSRSSPEDIAETVVNLIGKVDPPLRVRATFDAKIFAFLRWAIPGFLFHRIMFVLLPHSKEWGIRSRIPFQRRSV